MKRRFSILELIAALVICSFMLTAYITTLGHTRGRLHDLTQQQRAISILDNTVERLSGINEVTLSQLEALLTHEFEVQQIPRKDELVAEVAESADSVELRIRRDKRTLARVEWAK